MSAPVPRCGRMDAHEPHDYTVGARIINGFRLPASAMVCPGDVTTEMNEQRRRLDAELAAERHDEWWAE